MEKKIKKRRNMCILLASMLVLYSEMSINAVERVNTEKEIQYVQNSTESDATHEDISVIKSANETDMETLLPDVVFETDEIDIDEEYYTYNPQECEEAEDESIGDIENVDAIDDELAFAYIDVDTDDESVISLLGVEPERGLDGDISWNLDNKGTLTISGTGSIEDYNTDDTYGFRDANLKNEVVEIIIDDGIERVGNYAFDGYSNLVSVKLADSVKSIGEKAFFDCPHLNRINFPQGLSFDTQAFYGTNLKSAGPDDSYDIIYQDWPIRGNIGFLKRLRIPDGVETIEKQQFQYWSLLEEIYLPESIKTVECLAFEGNDKLAKVTLPVTARLDANAFCMCPLLKTMGPHGGGYDIELLYDTALEGDKVFNIQSFYFPELTDITVPEGFLVLESLPYGVDKVERVILPEGLELIDEFAFSNVSKSLREVNIPSTVKTIGKSAFSGCEALETIEISEGVMKIDDYAFSGCKSLKKIVFPNTLVSIGRGSFSGSGLTEVYLPDSVSSIGGYAFSSCSLSSVRLSNSITRINAFTFYDARSLTSLIIPSSVEYIGEGAFRNCGSLKYIECWGQNLQTIAEDAFMGAGRTNIPIVLNTDNRQLINYHWIQTVEYYSLNIPELFDYVIDTGKNMMILEEYKGKLTEIEIPQYGYIYGDKYQVALDGTFTDNTMVKKITIDDGAIIQEASDLFSGCDLLEYVRLPSNVECIGDYMFCGCKNLISVNLPDSVETIGKYAFYNCKKLKISELPGNLSQIGQVGFYNCSNLSFDTLPNGMTSIGDGAFYNCSGIDKIIYSGDDLIVIGDNAFYTTNNVNTNLLTDNETLLNYQWKSSNREVNVTSLSWQNDYEYTVNTSENRIELTKYIGDETDIRVPNTAYVDSEEIGVALTGSTFSGNEGLTSVCIDSNVVVLDTTSMFEGCTELNKIELPSTVTQAKENMFKGCGNLSSLTMPTISSIEEGVFCGCEKLKAVSLSNQISVIPDSAFEGCTSLATITLPNSLQKIGKKAFYDCNGLTEIYIPTRVSSIGEEAFYNCAGLGMISYPGDNLTKIGSHSFYVDSSLPTELMTNNYTLLHYDWESDNRTTTTVSQSWYTDYTYQISGGKMVLTKYKGTAQEVVVQPFAILNGTRYPVLLEGNVFYKNASITSVVIKNGAQISERITSTTTNGTVVYANAHTFGSCTSLKRVVLPDGLKSIGDFDFAFCDQLESVYIPDSVETIRMGAFSHCSKLDLEKLSDNLRVIESTAFEFCDELSLSSLPAGVTRIGDMAFCSCENLTISKIPDECTEIASGVFMQCDSIERIILPSKLKTLGKQAFFECPNLSYIEYFGDDLNSIGEKTFWVSNIVVTSVKTDNTLFQSLNWTDMRRPMKTCTVSYYGDNRLICSDEAIYYSVISEPNCSIKDGYYVTEWYYLNENNEEIIWNYDSDRIEDDISLYAKLSPCKYQVSFDSNGADLTYDDIEVVFDSAYGELPVPSRDGYIFQGWYTAKEDGVRIDSESIVSIPENHTLYAIWRGIDCVITFDANGGTVDEQSRPLIAGAPIGELPVPNERVGYSFVGWYLSKTGNVQITSESIVNRYTDFTVYARWTPISYIISYASNGGSGTMPDDEANYDTSFRLSRNSFYLLGYHFSEWNTRADGSGDSYDDQEAVLNLKSEQDDSITLYAQWLPNAYTINYSANGGTGTMASDTAVYDEELNLKASTFTKTGYHFAEWNTRSDGSGDSYEDEASVINLVSQNNGSITLYEQWAPNTYQIIYHANGGSGTMESASATYDQDIKLSKNTFEKTGYLSKAWRLNDSETGVSYSDQAVVRNLSSEQNGEAHLYAYWLPISYSIKYDANGGTGSMGYTYAKYDSEATIQTNAYIRTGYTFVEWNTKADGTGVSYQGNDKVLNLTSLNHKSITLYAQWTPNKYTLSYNANGGTGIMGDDQATYDSPIKLKVNTFTRTGYRFIGWNTQEDGSGNFYNDKAIAQNLTASNNGTAVLYAQWSAESYVVSFDANGGTVGVTSRNVTYDDKYSLNGRLPVPTWTGHVFLGWYLSAEEGDQVNNDTVCKTAQNHTLYAHWELGQYYVFFNANGGARVSSIIVTYSEPYGELPVTTRTGYTFVGWFTSSSGGTEITSDTPVNKGDNHNLYAHWRANTYQIVFDSNGGTGTMEPINAIYDESVQLPKNTFSKIGYNFVGWSLKGKYGGYSGNFDDQEEVRNLTSEPNGTVTLSAWWNPIKYYIKYEANGGTGTMSWDYVAYNKAVSLRANSFTRTGYRFAGWNTSANGDGTAYADTEEVIGLLTQNNSSITMYAQWEAIIYTLTFSPEGGTLDESELTRGLIYQTKYGALPVPVRPGYQFMGWYTLANGKGSKVTENTMLDQTANRTVYAYWKPYTYNITIDAAGGSADKQSLSIVFGTKYTGLPSRAIRFGYKFLGWFTEADGGDKITAETVLSIPDDHTLYAHWEQIATDAPTASLPVMTPESKALAAGTGLFLSSASDYADIYYMINGDISDAINPVTGEPDTAADGVRIYDDVILLSDVYAERDEHGNFVTDLDGDLIISISAVALKPGFAISDVVTFTYYIHDEASDLGDVRSEAALAAVRALKGYGEGTPVKDSDIPKGLWIAGVDESVPYSGSAFSFAIADDDTSGLEVFYHKKKLIYNTDYTVKYSGNTNAGTATLTVTGKGNYSGSIAKDFTIEPLPLDKIVEGVSVNSDRLNAADVTAVYNGRIQKLPTSVTYRISDAAQTAGVTLKEGTDFTYFYPHTDRSGNAETDPYDETAFVGAADVASTAGSCGYTDYTVYIVGKGNYAGTAAYTERIYAGEMKTVVTSVDKLKVKAISAWQLAQDEEGQVVPATPVPSVNDGTAAVAMVAPDSDADGVSVSYLNNETVGTATAVIRGHGKYVGERRVTFKVNGVPMTKVTVTDFAGTFDYTGDKIKPVAYDPDAGSDEGFKLWYGKTKTSEGTLLRPGRDYEITYSDNVSVGRNRASITFTGKGIYSGTLKKTFSIQALTLNETNVEMGRINVTVPASVAYTKGGSKPAAVVTYDGTLLIEGTDYTVKYKNNTSVNRYAGGRWDNNRSIPALTITGKGNYSGALTRQFAITPSSLQDTGVQISAKDVVYSNKPGNCMTTVILTDANGTRLTAGTDYSSSFVYKYKYDSVVKIKTRSGMVDVDVYAGDQVDMYREYIQPGTVITVTVEATARGNYAGVVAGKVSSITTSFRVVEADISKASVKAPDRVYTGRPIELSKEDLTVTLGRQALGVSDYDIVPGSFTNNVNKGTASFTIKGRGTYGGMRTVTFKIINKSMNIYVTYDNNEKYMHGEVTPSAPYPVTATIKGTVRAGYVASGGKLARNSYSLSGFTFTGWNTERDGSGTQFASGGTFNSSAGYGEELTLYAQWAPVVYKLTYKTNGGSNDPSNPTTYTAYERIEIEAPSRAGYKFMGWYYDSRCVTKPLESYTRTLEDGTEVITCVITRGTTGNRTLYAKWEKNP